MVKRMIIMLVATGLVLGAIFGFQAYKNSMIKQFMSSMAAPPQSVSTVTADVQQWQPRLSSVGTLRAVNGADLASEVAGIVEEVNVNSGDDVAAGTVLLRLRAEDDVARLRSLEATAELAAITYQRNERQLRVQAISQATVDSDAANLKNARAQVAEQKAVIDKKTIRAPFAGRLGIRHVDRGQYLSAGATIVTLQALDPIYVDFYLPQQALDEIRVGQPVTAIVDTWPDQPFAGTISAVNPKVELATRNVQVRATLKNPDRKLLPGMFASVTIESGEPSRHITLPQTAITYNPYGDTVYLVVEEGTQENGEPKRVAKQSFVTLGGTRGDLVAVLKGVEPGQTVVSGGQMKLRNGVPVTINNSVQPTADASPAPVDR